MMEEKEFRKPTTEELAILNKLLEADFAGAKELRQQVDGLVVKKVDENGSLRLHVSTEVFGQVTHSVPVEGSYSKTKSTDPFEPRVHFLLHVLAGALNELEIYTDDDSPLEHLPNAGALEVETYPAAESE
jgi:ketosteroid isomerase-like protein